MSRLRKREITIRDALGEVEVDTYLTDFFVGYAEGRVEVVCEMAKETGLKTALKIFGLTEEEMRAVLDPAKYTGRCGNQVTALANRLRPLFADATETKDSIEV